MESEMDGDVSHQFEFRHRNRNLAVCVGVGDHLTHEQVSDGFKSNHSRNNTGLQDAVIRAYFMAKSIQFQNETESSLNENNNQTQRENQNGKLGREYESASFAPFQKQQQQRSGFGSKDSRFGSYNFVEESEGKFCPRPRGRAGAATQCSRCGITDYIAVAVGNSKSNCHSNIEGGHICKSKCIQNNNAVENQNEVASANRLKRKRSSNNIGPVIAHENERADTDSSSSFGIHSGLYSLSESNKPCKKMQKYSMYDLHTAAARDSRKQIKFGSDALLSLSVSQDVNARLTLEGYREEIANLLRDVNRSDLLPMMQEEQSLKSKVDIDPVEEYYTDHRYKNFEDAMSSDSAAELKPDPPSGRILRSTTKKRKLEELPKAKFDNVTCEVKMRVRIQYKTHSHLLSEIESVKNSEEERQMDKFFQATNIMRGRDTGCVVCDISFTDITYLGAFWRDYTNGALQEALKSVFLTEMMRQTAGNEELELLVSVDEKDFKKGQDKLVYNLWFGDKEGTNLPGGIDVQDTRRRPAASTARVER